MTDLTPDPIMRTATGFMASKHLFTAAAIGIFEKLGEATMTLDELSAACGVPPRTMRISADAMLSLGLIESSDGRGTGSFLSAILRRHATLHATLFELPGASAVARQRLASEPEGSRVAVVEGDFFKDPLPDGHDVMIVANTIHVLSAQHNIDLLTNMRAHAPAGARLAPA